jgi:short subunit dehydrogenase-like uncharacterized protein
MELFRMSKAFDLVVHGATGFTGRLVVEYLLQRYPAGSGVRWAMGGRNADKLAAVRDEVGAPADTPLIVTDTANPASLQLLMDQTRLVLTTVGPYQLYGNELVAACARSGVDYVDLCGEPAWMRHMIDAHHAAAQTSGARIVFSCGFDSIPFDLGVFKLQNEMRQRFGHAANRVRGRVRKMKGTFSGGTAASLKATMVAAATDPSRAGLVAQPVFSHARFRRASPAVRSQTHGGRGAGLVGGTFHHGGHQHPQRAPLQLPAWPRLRGRLRVRRNAGHRRGRQGRSDCQCRGR